MYAGSKYLLENFSSLVQILRSDNNFDKFSKLQTDSERVKFLYNYAIGQPINFVDDKKDSAIANELKTRANCAFGHSDYKKALTRYNEALIACPVNTPEGKSAFAILLANRSATFMKLGKNYEALTDLDAIEEEHYPERLKHKLMVRRAECLYELKRPTDEILSCYSKAMEFLPIAKLTVTENGKWQEKISNGILQAKNEYSAPCVHAESNQLNLDKLFEFEPNGTYPALSRKVTVLSSAEEGRFIKAVETISPGQIVAIEKPHVSVVASERKLDHCEHCQISCVNMFPCPNCTQAVYCSLNCRQYGEVYHRFECKILGTIYNSGASVNCRLALRTVTQQELAFLLEKSKDPLKDPLLNGRYLTENYDTVYNLVSHSSSRSTTEYLHYTLMTTYLLRLLKLSHYFGSETNDKILTEHEAAIGGYILYHLQQFQFNAHEISDVIQTSQEELNSNPFRKPSVTQSVGAGIYPTLALFNHSCENSVVRYNKGGALLLRAIKTIQPGDCVYDNYGISYTCTELDERRKNLSANYWFVCKCIACESNWPRFPELNTDEYSFPCKKCRRPYSFNKFTDVPEFICPPPCNTANNIVPALFEMLAAAKSLEKAEQYYEARQYDKSLLEFSTVVETYCKHSLLPSYDIVKLQQRMKTCMANLGNIDHTNG